MKTNTSTTSILLKHLMNVLTVVPTKSCLIILKTLGISGVVNVLEKCSKK